MTSTRRPWPAYANQNEIQNPLRGLVELLLDLLLSCLGAGRCAELTLDGGPAATTMPDSRYAWRGDPEASGQPLSTRAPLPRGGIATLTVRGPVGATADVGNGHEDDATTRVQLERFIKPMLDCVALQQRLDEQAGRARTAIAEIEREAMTDLATGIVMARRDCDPATARARVIEWSSRTGLDLNTLSAARMLEILTAAQP